MLFADLVTPCSLYQTLTSFRIDKDDVIADEAWNTGCEGFFFSLERTCMYLPNWFES